MYCKINTDGTVEYPPCNDGNRFNVNMDVAWLVEHGYTDVPEADIPTPPIPEPEPGINKYSTLKIIRALGDQWETIRQQLASSGVLDQFFAANYLRSDDPVFAAWLDQIPDSVKAILPNCIWEPNDGFDSLNA